MRTRVLLGLCLVLTMLAAVSCASGERRSTRITHADMDDAVEKMAMSLAGSDVLRLRGPDSPPLVIVLNKVQNLTNDIITVSEQWMMVARVRGAIPIQELSQQKNVRFVISPERQPMLRDAGYTGDLGKADQPTHVMTATFLSSQRGGRGPKDDVTRYRSNYYYMEWEMIALHDRERVWSDAFEFKHHAVGTVID